MCGGGGRDGEESGESVGDKVLKINRLLFYKILFSFSYSLSSDNTCVNSTEILNQ